jgi:hypothetical protein
MSPEEGKALDVQLKVWHLERRHCGANTSIPRLSLLDLLVPVRGLVHHRHVPIFSRADIHNSRTPQMATLPRVSVASATILQPGAPLSRASRNAARDGSSTQIPHTWISPDERAATISILKTTVHLVERIRPLIVVTLSLPPCRALLPWLCQLVESSVVEGEPKPHTHCSSPRTRPCVCWFQVLIRQRTSAAESRG